MPREGHFGLGFLTHLPTKPQTPGTYSRSRPPPPPTTLPRWLWEAQPGPQRHLVVSASRPVLVPGQGGVPLSNWRVPGHSPQEHLV